MRNLPKIALGAWAWAIAKGTLPIIGVTKVSHVEDAVKAANVTLTGRRRRAFKPVLFEFPTYEYFVTGEKVGDCGRMNAE